MTTKRKGEVLILARTIINEHKDCLGGIDIASKESIRLMVDSKVSKIENLPYKIGDIWELEYEVSTTTIAPHVEDVFVVDHTPLHKHLDKPTITAYLDGTEDVLVWNGSINDIFEQKLNWTKGGIGYLTLASIPKQSVGFWKSDKTLYHSRRGSDWYYYTDTDGRKKYIKYAGKEEPMKEIPANTLLRVSLTRWLKSSRKNIEERSYLQLSGWYY